MRYSSLILACFVLGCSSDDDPGKATGGTGGQAGAGGSGATGGTAGSAGSAAAGGQAGSAGGGGAAASAGSSGSAGAGGSAGATSSCVDASNPMFGSCAQTFLASCYQPDTSGTCTDQNDTVSWSDGHKYISSGANAGMYGPGDTTPCVTIVVQGGNITATKGNEVLKYAPDQTSGKATVTCPTGSSFTATFAQVTAFNRCVGVNCPGN